MSWLIQTLGVIFTFAVHQTHGALSDREFMVNIDMEEPFDKDWLCYSSCSLEQSTDSYAGIYSAKVGSRNSKHSGVRQNVELEVPGGTFYYTARMKLVNELPDEFPTGHAFEIAVNVVSGGKSRRVQIAKVPNVRMSDGWVQLGGDFRVPDVPGQCADTVTYAYVYRTTGVQDCVKISLYAYPSDSEKIDYLLDSVSLRKFNGTEDSVHVQNARIEAIRKGDIPFLIITPDGNDYRKVTLELEQEKHAFPFGMAIEGSRLYNDNEPVNLKYREYFFDNFNWATLANMMKWRFMESQENNPRFYSAHRALDILTERGIPVRGHCVSWGKQQKIMGWLKNKDVPGVKEAIERRIKYLIREFNLTSIKHWDVVNENLHGDWYEEHTMNDQIIQSFFTTLHDLQPDVKLFTNDYDAMSLSLFTSAYRNFVMKLKMNGVPISGIGLQSHLSVYPDPELLEKRLEVMSEAGVPLWITELDVRQEDVNLRAQGYEDALRLFFSHPSVEGIIIWGFWDKGISYEFANLVDGDDFVENEAGRRVRHLLNKEWHSSESHVPEQAVEIYNPRAFYGTYKVTLKYKKNIIWNGTIEHTADESRKYILTADRHASPDQIFRMST